MHRGPVLGTPSMAGMHPSRYNANASELKHLITAIIIIVVLVIIIIRLNMHKRQRY